MITGVPAPAIPSWLLEPLWDQFAALVPDRPVYDPAHPLGCHRRDEWIEAGIFSRLKQIALEPYDRIVGLVASFEHDCGPRGLSYPDVRNIVITRPPRWSSG